MMNKTLLVAFGFLLTGSALAGSDESWESRKNRARSKVNFNTSETDVSDAFRKLAKSFAENKSEQDKQLQAQLHSLEIALNKTKTELEVERAETLLFNSITAHESSSNRSAPVRVTGSHQPALGRFLMNCSHSSDSVTQWIFLDVAEKFMNRTWKLSKRASNLELNFNCTKEKTGS